MKRSITLLLSLILLTSVAQWALGEEYPPTTDKEIDFFDIPWRISDSKFLKSMDEKGIKYRKSYINYGDPDASVYKTSTSYGDGQIIPYASSEYVPTREYWIQGDGWGSLCQVAGHVVFSMRVYFFRPETYTKSIYTELYHISIQFGNTKAMSETEQYSDLFEKLSALYGTPYTYESSSTTYFGKSNSVTSVWIGAENTAVYLEFCDGLDTDLDYVKLDYTLIDSADRFKQIEQAHLEYIKTQNEKNKDNIKDDYSGL